MKVYGRAAVSEYLGDQIVYRNLAPLDSRLPSLAEADQELGLPPGRIPRKSEADYARVVVHLLRAAWSLESYRTPVRRLIFIGDTRMNDSTAFANICQAGRWPGVAFIGDENSAPAEVQTTVVAPEQTLYLANRWSALVDFDRYCGNSGLPVDEAAAVVIDLDKTAIGARGRNAHVIDNARVKAVHTTVAGLLGLAFNQEKFLAAYDRLKQPEFHPFTADNQDYLAYICLILGSGLYDRDTLIAEVGSGQMQSFRQFIDRIDLRAAELPAGLSRIHTEIYENVKAGDPTPFKPFRRNEYLETVGHMGYMSDGTPAADLLAEEIVLTQEVRTLALEWRQRGALLFGLSDKPDEASIPTEELSRQGYLPIHRTVTHAVGE
jgi:hypothetical protein